MTRNMSDMSNKILTRIFGNLCSSPHEPMFIGPRTYVHRLMNPIIPKGGSLQAKRQGRGSLCTRLIISLLLMMVLGVNSVWGVDYKYIIINNKGNKAFNYTIRGDIEYSSIDKEQLCVHPKAKSV